MFKTIVLATDLSPAWDEIVACAGEFKALGCSRVILTNVIVTRFLVGLEEMLRADVRPKLEAQQRQLEAQGLQVEVEMPIGLPASSLNDIACSLWRRSHRGGLPRHRSLAGGGAGVLYLCGGAPYQVSHFAH